MIFQQKSNIKEAIDNTLKKYSFESINHQIDNLDSTQSHHTYNMLNIMMKSKLCSLVIIQFLKLQKMFLSYKDNEYYFNTNVYYTNSDGQIICRYKNRGEDNIYDDKIMLLQIKMCFLK